MPNECIGHGKLRKGKKVLGSIDQNLQCDPCCGPLPPERCLDADCVSLLVFLRLLTTLSPFDADIVLVADFFTFFIALRLNTCCKTHADHTAGVDAKPSDYNLILPGFSDHL
jgi:hypothetical protein